jgi:uncharacterized RDD family membrane protein YckC
MNDDYTLLTPENVDLHFEVAGVGSRVAAALIDYTILGTGYLVLTLGIEFAAALVLGALRQPSQNSDVLVYIGIGSSILLGFFGWWGYFILTEMLWNGQSIGKRRLGLRVVRVGGQPISLTASLIRNLLRIVDIPSFVGIIVMIIDSRSRRLGDLAAGTLVIREPHASLPKDLTKAFREIEIPTVSDAAIEGFANPERLTAAHYALLRDYFARRPGLTPERAHRLAETLAARLAASLGDEPGTIDKPVQFLASAARAYEARQRPTE